MIGGVSGPNDHGHGKKPDHSDQVETGIGRDYTAAKAPGVKKWFETHFPKMSPAQIDKAVQKWMVNEMHYMSSFMARLEAQRKKAYREMKKSIDGDD